MSGDVKDDAGKLLVFDDEVKGAPGWLNCFRCW
jgi:hypothetical protein